jgi:hypothetical protein
MHGMKIKTSGMQWRTQEFFRGGGGGGGGFNKFSCGPGAEESGSGDDSPLIRGRGSTQFANE